MTQATPPATNPEWSPQPAPPAPAPVARPGMVTGAGITLIVLGVLTTLLGLFFLLGVAIFAGAAGGAGEAAGAPELGGMFGALAGVIAVVAFIVIAFGVLQFLSGLMVLGGRSWARVTGIVLAVVGALLALAGMAGEGGNVVLSLALAAANVFVIFALATTGPWFAARRT